VFGRAIDIAQPDLCHPRSGRRKIAAMAERQLRVSRTTRLGRSPAWRRCTSTSPPNFVIRRRWWAPCPGTEVVLAVAGRRQRQCQRRARHRVDARGGEASVRQEVLHTATPCWLTAPRWTGDGGYGRRDRHRRRRGIGSDRAGDGVEVRSSIAELTGHRRAHGC
jgi:hypothetical protein